MAVAKRYHYRVYIDHPYGTDKMIVTLTGKRSVERAGQMGLGRLVRHRGTGDARVADVIPMKMIDGKLVETRKRRVTVRHVKFVNSRPAKARVVKRVHKKRVL